MVLSGARPVLCGIGDGGADARSGASRMVTGGWVASLRPVEVALKINGHERAGWGGPSTERFRERVLDAAVGVFAARGIGCASMGEVATAAGVSKRAVLALFASKNELLLGLTDRYVRDRLRLAVAAFDAALGAAGDLHLAWRRVGDSLFAATEADHVCWQHLLFDAVSQARRDPALGTALARRRREHLAAATAQVSATVVARNLRLPVSAHELAVSILALSNGLALEAGIDPGGCPLTCSAGSSA